MYIEMEIASAFYAVLGELHQLFLRKEAVLDVLHSRLLNAMQCLFEAYRSFLSL